MTNHSRQYRAASPRTRLAEILLLAGISSVTTHDVLQKVGNDFGIHVGQVQTIHFTDGRTVKQNLWFDGNGRFHHASDAQ